MFDLTETCKNANLFFVSYQISNTITIKSLDIQKKNVFNINSKMTIQVNFVN